MKDRISHKVFDGSMDLPIITDANFATVGNEIDYLNLSVASNYLSSKIKAETKNLIKKTSDQVKNTLTFKEGMKFLDELRTDTLPIEKASDGTKTNDNKQLRDSAFMDSIYSTNYADVHNSLDMVDGEMVATQTFLSPQETETLSAATTFITDMVTNEARKIVSFTGDQIKKTSKFQESMKYFDELCEECEEINQLKELKYDLLKVAQRILSHPEEKEMTLSFSELLNQFNSGLLYLKQQVSFCEGHLSTSEISVFSDVVSLSITKRFYIQIFENTGNAKKQFFLDENVITSFDKSFLKIIENNQPSYEEIASSVIPVNQINENMGNKLNHQVNAEKFQIPSSDTSYCHILEIFRKTTERPTYDEKFMLLIKFCNDLFIPEALFSQLSFDYLVWRELVQLFMKNNERQIFLTSFEFGGDEPNSSDSKVNQIFFANMTVHSKKNLRKMIILIIVYWYLTLIEHQKWQ